MILKVFSNHNDSMILYSSFSKSNYYFSIIASFRKAGEKLRERENAEEMDF